MTNGVFEGFEGWASPPGGSLNPLNPNFLTSI